MLVDRRLVIGEGFTTDFDRAVVLRCLRVLVKVHVRQDAVGLDTKFCLHDKFRSVSTRGASGNNDRSTRDHETTQDLLVLSIPKPVADFGVKGVVVLFTLAPRCGSVVKSVHCLLAIFDWSKLLERRALEIGRFSNFALFIVERHVHTLVALPRTDQTA